MKNEVKTRCRVYGIFCALQNGSLRLAIRSFLLSKSNSWPHHRIVLM